MHAAPLEPEREARTRWVVFGAAGMLGRELVLTLREREIPVLALSHIDADITQQASIVPHVRQGDIVVNCAAWTRVDDAENHREEAMACNAVGPLHLARVCADARATLIQLSTDYVFGAASSGSAILVDAPMHPQCVYGESKALGEQYVREVLGETALIARTAWLYGKHGRNFVHTMRERLDDGAALRVVDDQIGQPTWTRDVAAALLRLISTERAGTHHLTSAGQCSWYEFACAIADLTGHDASAIVPVPTSEYPTAARRPAWSVLAHEEGHLLPHWRDSLREYLT